MPVQISPSSFNQDTGIAGRSVNDLYISLLRLTSAYNGEIYIYHYDGEAFTRISPSNQNLSRRILWMYDNEAFVAAHYYNDNTDFIYHGK
jgi:hypothetical protein